MHDVKVKFATMIENMRNYLKRKETQKISLKMEKIEAKSNKKKYYFNRNLVKSTKQQITFLDLKTEEELRFLKEIVNQTIERKKNFHHVKSILTQCFFINFSWSPLISRHIENWPLINCSFESNNRCRYLLHPRIQKLKYFTEKNLEKTIFKEINPFQNLNYNKSFAYEFIEFCNQAFQSSILKFFTKIKINNTLYEIINEKYPIIHEFHCSRTNGFYEEKGILIMSTENIIFVNELEIEEKTEKSLYFLFVKKELLKNPVYRKYPHSLLKNIIKKQFIHKKNSIELIYQNRKPLLLLFTNEKEVDELISQISQIKKNYSNINEMSNLHQGISFDKLCFTEQWRKWEISNFDYLMTLNYYSGRSFNNFSQFPVFPWVIHNYEGDEFYNSSLKTYRDLTKNIGGNSIQNKIDHFTSRYEDKSDPDGSYHFGSHYSNPMIVFEYLMRLSPYYEGCLELFNGKFDSVERIIHSIEDSYQNILTDYFDLRELIPQFYYLPEMFLNIENLLLGKKENQEEVSDVRLPKWCHGSSYIFVSIMRQALESDHVSFYLNHWIDLIFGYKQRGKEAEKSLNVFHPVTYDNYIPTNPNEAEPKILQGIHFGQTPSQLFYEPHIQRYAKNKGKVYSIFDKNSDLMAYVQKEPNPKYRNHRVIRICSRKNTSLISLSKDGITVKYKWNPNFDIESNVPFKVSEDGISQTQLLIRDTFMNFEISSPPSLFFETTNGTLNAIIGGYLDGSIFEYEFTENAKLSHYTLVGSLSSAASCLCYSIQSKILFAGSISGLIASFVNVGQDKWAKKKEINNFGFRIQSMNVSDELGLLITGDVVGNVTIHRLSIKLEVVKILNMKISIDFVNLFISPLAGFIFFSSHVGKFESYSINGYKMGEFLDPVEIIDSPVLGKDSCFNNHIAYIGKSKEKTSLTILNITLMEKTKEVKITNPSTIFLSKDNRFIFYGTEEGTTNVITDKKGIALISNQ